MTREPVIPQPVPAEAASTRTSFEALLLAAVDDAVLEEGWQVQPSGEWIKVRRRSGHAPEQGWKLHVSAGVRTAPEVLRQVLPVLFRESVDFKIAASIEQLAKLNEGRGGPGQVGKFVTVYPSDDAQAVRTAVRLQQVTEGLRGPRIPSDRRLRPLSLVHYRYGGFGTLHTRTPLGESLPAITAPDGRLVPDRREPRDTTPDWAVDPFIAAGIVEPESEEAHTLGERFVILATLHQSPRTRVDLCLDLTSAGTCVVKRAYEDGSGSHDRLRHEYEVLHQLTGHVAPRALGLFTHGQELCLAMTDVPGVTLDHVMSGFRQANQLPTTAQLREWAGQLGALVAALHEQGVVHGDLKPSNIIVTEDGLRIVDFELASAPGAIPVGNAQGTHGYRSPQRGRGTPASYGDDDYSFGAALFACATGAEPSHAPFPDELLRRPVHLLNPRMDSGACSVIDACLKGDPGRRLGATAAAARLSATGYSVCEIVPPPQLSAQTSGAMALRIGDLLATAFTDADPQWPSCHPQVESLDLNTGAAGALVVLAELARQSAAPSLRAGTARGARWLFEAWSRTSPRLPGLYVGDAGIGAALLRAGLVLADDEIISAACIVAREGLRAPLSSPDLFNGTAGRIRFLLWLWIATREQDMLDHAVDWASHLTSAQTGRRGEAGWPIPAGYDSLSGRTLLGYAHGAAGIGDVLLDLFEVTGRADLLESATAVGSWLERTATAAGHDQDGLNWPAEESSRPTMAFWCHGAGGITRFFLHLHRHSRRPMHRAIAERAGQLVADGTRWSGPTQCHGLAGNLECILDLYQATGEPAYLKQAGEFGQLLSAFVVERSGHLEVVTDRDSPNLGFSTGAGGVAAALLRLADKDQPHLLALPSWSGLGNNMG